MKVVMLMFDTLNRHMLSPYGCDWTHTPNFQRLARRTVTFDKSYVCSMPCMPARRDLHTGRPNFLHRSWGPHEPFDDSMPRMLKEANIHSHLVSDHYHYWEDGGCTYHTKYRTWDFHRGQEGDPWISQIAGREATDRHLGRNASDYPWVGQDRVNRRHIRDEHHWPQSRTVRGGIEFMRTNRDQDHWFLQIETFDPHEPFYAHRQYHDLFQEHYEKWRAAGNRICDWPNYDYVNEPPDVVEHLRYEYASLLAMCDAKLGDVLDTMDELNLWEDTMLIVWTDHGFMLSEHDCWAKIWMPFYEEVAHTPFFVWDPRCKKQGERRSALVQPAIDLAPTVLDCFGLAPTPRMLGKNLRDTIADDTPVREAAIFGVHGGQINITDGRYVYFKGPANPDNQPLFNYTLMPTHMRGPFEPDELAGKITLAEPFDFTRDIATMKIPCEGSLARGMHLHERLKTELYDVNDDPLQKQPIHNPDVQARLTTQMVELMKQCDAPAEQYVRMGLTPS